MKKIIIIIAFLIAACNNPVNYYTTNIKNNKFVGTWTQQGRWYAEFNNNNEFKSSYSYVYNDYIQLTENYGKYKVLDSIAIIKMDSVYNYSSISYNGQNSYCELYNDSTYMISIIATDYHIYLSDTVTRDINFNTVTKEYLISDSSLLQFEKRNSNIYGK